MKTNKCRRLTVALAALLVTMTTAVMASSIKTFTVAETRDMRFCEILIVKESGVEVYNTTGLNDCPPKLWNALDLEKLKKQFGALQVKLNGPKFWLMDTQTVSLGEKASFEGLEARWAATLDPMCPEPRPPEPRPA